MTVEPRPETDFDEEEEQAERAAATTGERIAELLTAARAARGEKDLARSHALYTEAASLGSTDADYALGVFALSGQVVARDPKVGATHLRRAADAGHLQARVHLANALDTGTIAGQPEPERAALFVRGVARSLGLAGTESPDDQRALAEAGLGRFLAEIPDATYEESTRWSKKARALGYGKRGPASDPELPPVQTSAVSSAPAALTTAPAGAEVPAKPRVKPRRKPSGPTAGEAAAAAGFALLFLVAGWGVAFASVQAAHAALEQGRELPALGTRVDLLWPLAVGVVGVLPATLFYRGGAFLRAFGAGLIAAFAGFMLHGTGTLVVLEVREMQALAIGTAVFWGALLVLGFLGGAKASKKAEL